MTLAEHKPPQTFSVVFARWQQYIRQRFALSGDGKEFTSILS